MKVHDPEDGVEGFDSIVMECVVPFKSGQPKGRRTSVGAVNVPVTVPVAAVDVLVGSVNTSVTVGDDNPPGTVREAARSRAAAQLDECSQHQIAGGTGQDVRAPYKDQARHPPLSTYSLAFLAAIDPPTPPPIAAPTRTTASRADRIHVVTRRQIICCWWF